MWMISSQMSNSPATAFDKPAKTTDDTSLTLFRQNLQDYATKWWMLEYRDR